MLRSKRAVAIAAVTVAAAGGAGVAVAATSSNSGPSNFLDDVAKHLGISRQKLDDATKAAAIDQVNADLAAGRITKDQADALKKRIESGDVPPLAALRGGGPGFGGRGFGFGPGGPAGPAGPAGAPGMLKGFLQDGLSAAAKYLGLSESDLRTKLASGQSLADVAKAQKKDVTGLQDAIVAAEKADLDKAVADKQLTQSQADDALSQLKARIGDLVNGQLRFGDRHGGYPGRPGFGIGLDAAAKYLGLTQAQLRQKLTSGQSLADVAKAQKKDVAGLQAAITADAKSRLDKAVADKKLTQAQADKLLSALKSRIDDAVNTKPPAGAPRLHQRPGGGPRFFFGP
jgi:predicted XRE-type DNA-binding protein